MAHLGTLPRLPYEDTNAAAISRFLGKMQASRQNRFDQTLLEAAMSGASPEEVRANVLSAMEGNRAPQGVLGRILNTANPAGPYGGPMSGQSASILSSVMGDTMQYGGLSPEERRRAIRIRMGLEPEAENPRPEPDRRPWQYQPQYESPEARALREADMREAAAAGRPKPNTYEYDGTIVREQPDGTYAPVWQAPEKPPKPEKPDTQTIGGRIVERQPDGSYREVYTAPEKPEKPPQPELRDTDRGIARIGATGAAEIVPGTERESRAKELPAGGRVWPQDILKQFDSAPTMSVSDETWRAVFGERDPINYKGWNDRWQVGELSLEDRQKLAEYLAGQQTAANERAYRGAQGQAAQAQERGPASIAEFEAEVKRLNATNPAAAKAYYDRWSPTL